MAKKVHNFPVLPGRRAQPVSLAITDAIDRAISDFEAQLGGRPELIAALSVTDLTPKIAEILSILGDPENDSVSLAQICQKHRIAPAEILDAYKAARIGRAQLLGITTATAAIPAIVQDLAARAVVHNGLCSDCHGSGKTTRIRTVKGESQEITSDCLVCSGVGTVLRPADPAAQERILDMTGLLPKSGPGIAIGVQTTVNTGGSGGVSEGSIVKLQDAVSKILSTPNPGVSSPAAPTSGPGDQSRTPPPIEAEIVSASD